MSNHEKSNAIEKFENWMISSKGKLYGVQVGATLGCIFGVTLTNFIDNMAAIAVCVLVILSISKIIFEIRLSKKKVEKDYILYGEGGTEEDVS